MYGIYTKKGDRELERYACEHKADDEAKIWKEKYGVDCYVKMITEY